ncbi:hypothetical protein D8M04_05280 [Oceanobacillus piezotolerans]|uniref:Uncharacterized protein n=1 Tax=Oceanobacillus piezotolerans TaxID=2448030 RepID=A0A498DPY1_9BACI|nr:hypothetical protein [Oceanobacillus piezotolerans]RLL46619.1 hypothetical protein D8M04_05280 [Oceanobacillus piezotolerans]
MDNLTREQTLDMLNDLLEEDVSSKFNEQLQYVGEHGEPSFVVANNEGKSVEVFVDWNKEADLLSFSINEDYTSE